VSWQAPSQGPVTRYTVTAAPGGATAIVDGSVTQAAVAGLTNGVSYTFTVVATNRAGNGPASAASAAVTPSAPAPVAPIAPIAPVAPGGRWLSGYYVGYQRSLYPEASVDFTNMTHIIVGAVQATPTGGVTTDFWVDNTNGPLMAKTLTSRAHQAGRKAIMMLGGAGYRTNLVSATSNAYRATFVQNLLATMDDLGFDGIDVDWEPLLETDRPQVLQFLNALRAARPGILITFPVDWANTNAGVDPWYNQLASLVDQMNVMSYQMADNWGGWVSWHHAALYNEAGNRPSSISGTIRAYTNVGVPAAKLGIGIGAYGSCWRGVNDMYRTIDGTSASVVAGDNTMSFANIMAQYYQAAAYRWDDAAKAGFLGFAAPTGPQQCTMVSYEDEASVSAKGAYVKANGVGGAIVWTVQQGHLPTALNGSRDPLLRSAFNAMM
jgi:chitinase